MNSSLLSSYDGDSESCSSGESDFQYHTRHRHRTLSESSSEPLEACYDHTYRENDVNMSNGPSGDDSDNISLEEEYFLPEQAGDENNASSDSDTSLESLSSTDSSDSDHSIPEEVDANEEIAPEPLYENSRCTVQSFSYLLKVFAIKHSLSNKAVDELLRIFGHVLPVNNCCPPSSYKLNQVTKMFEHETNHFQLCQECHSQLQKNVCTNENCEYNGSKNNQSLNFFTFNIEKQLQKVVKCYSEDVMTFKDQAGVRGSFSSTAHGEVYRSKLGINRFSISLVWHIDGAPTIKSKTLDIWLMTAFIVEVPKKYRFALRNIIVCGIWYGNQKPNFDLFQLHFVREIKRLMQFGFTVMIINEEETFFVKIEASLADLPARASSLNIKQFNGRFGCPVCLHPGKSLNGTLVRVYPHQWEKPELRKHDQFCLHAEAAEQNNDSFFGVKGRSVVLDIQRIPKEIPFDYMHLSLEGELKRKLCRHIFSARGFVSKNSLEEMNTLLENVKYPHDFGKKVTFISEKIIRKGKAGFLQVLLLHVLLPVLKSHVPDEIFCHLGLFVTANQLLNKDTTNEGEICLAEEMMEEYHRLDVFLYGDRSQTFTNHALIHLADQRRQHGCSLVLLSNFVFEGFIASIKRQYHGTRGIVPQMVSNIGLLQNVREIADQIEDLQFKMLAHDITSVSSANKTPMADEICFYGIVRTAIPTVPDLARPLPDNLRTRFSSFCERIFYKNNVFHSYSYRYKRNSNSYMVSYYDGHEVKYGIVLFYACTEEDDSVVMVMKKLLPTAQTLFTPDMKGCLESAKVDSYIDNNQLGQCFQHVVERDVLVLHPAKFLISRVVFIACETGGGYVSNTLNSYQHD